jgi:hypothetical protein
VLLTVLGTPLAEVASLGSTTITVRAILNAGVAATTPITVNLGFRPGTPNGATLGADYRVSSTQIVIPAGSNQGFRSRASPRPE